MLLRTHALRSLRRAVRTAGAAVAQHASHSSSTISAVVSNLNSLSDVEDLYITYGRARGVPGPLDVRPLAVVKVGGEIITKDVHNLVASLQALREVGLYPVVVHGGGPQLNDELAKAGVTPNYIEGHRVTTPETMLVAKRVFEGANDDLAAALTRAGLPVGQIKGGVFQAEVHDARLGLVGEIKHVAAAAVEAALAADRIPVLTSLGINKVGETLNINADVAARELSITLRPQKVIFISAGGGWKEEGKIVADVNMATDYDVWVARDYTGRQGTLLKLKEMKRIVDHLPPSSSVTIASAAGMSGNMLPHRGPGSQIRRGIRLLSFDSAGACDATRLAALLRACGEDAGVAMLRDVTAVQSVARIIVTEDYSGAAVVIMKGEVPVLHTLALAPTAYSEGTEPALWRAISEAFPSIVWTGRASGPMRDAIAAATTSSIPAAFPALSSRRSLAYAHGSVSLDASPVGVGQAAMWRGPQTAAIKSWIAAATVPAAPAAIPRPISTAASSSRPVRVGLLGARGYVGREFVRLIAGHPDMRIVCASSRALVGQDVLTALGVHDAKDAVEEGLRVSDIGPAELRAGKAPAVDVWVLALPNGLAAEHSAAVDAAAAGARAPVLIDLSADYRFDKSGAWVYGLPERPGARALLRNARKISNPGCYATGAQAALMPLLPMHATGGPVLDPAHIPHVFGVSGYSGAGTTPSDKNDPAKLRDNLLPYALTGHIHEREVGHHCGTRIAFMPHVAPFFQGISLTVSMHLAAGGAPVTPEVLQRTYADFYAKERLISVLPGKAMPDVKSHGSFKQGVTVGGFTYDAASRRVVVVSVMDNLLKGAATQAVQNLNIALGLQEYAGIPS